ncbi:ABC transporter ATP-binding protein [Clostridium sp. 19966]|uniref:ABC transporter ATP-binding protein n=1 Tax=Clostridium sp. 19966 TaxID=2768166 RepID=UPI0028DE25AD|nr:ABC transporter ATP-binding protein [Clostridium sp. 19966]MDT8718167.1 ABC transporter ATP-binding protein [Clostridium sp. 19966]
MSSEKILEIKNLSNIYYNKRSNIFEKDTLTKVLKNIDFHIEKGEIFGLVGESGCGKSTLGRAIVNLTPNVQGEILVDGENIKNRKHISEKVQIVFQDSLSSLNPKKTIGWIMEEPLKIHKKGNKEERIKRVNEVLNLIGLDSSYRGRYPHELSGGQRQRISIGASIMLNPKLIVADEPVSALDVSIQSQILNLIMDLHDKLDLAFLFISHNLNVIYYLCNRVAVMYLGEIVELADATEIYNSPKHPYTKALLSSIPNIAVDSDKDIWEIKGDLKDSININKGCPYYPRCSYAKQECGDTKADIKNINKEKHSEHLVRCHLY